MTTSPRRAVIYGIAALLSIYLICFIAVLIASRQDQRQRADVIVVLGAAQYNGKPSPVLRARLDQAILLYRAGLAPKIVVTGGIGQGDRLSEAAVGQSYLILNRVRENDIVVRPEGRSTGASMASVAQWLGERSLHRALLVSDPFHSLRLHLEAHRVSIDAYTSPTTTSPISRQFSSELPYLLAESAKIPVVWLRSVL